MSHSNHYQEIDQQLDHCFKALKVFAKTIRQRHWNRLVEVRDIYEQHITLLKQLLEDAGLPDADSETASRLHVLEVEVRRVQRQLALSMADVKEAVETLDKGIRKVQRMADTSD